MSESKQKKEQDTEIENNEATTKVETNKSPEGDHVALSAEKLTKVYQGNETVRAVENVSFDIEREEFVSIIGPSGSGKSTILRMIAGFEEPTEGAVILDNMDITDWPPFDRDTNMMFQDLALFPNYTVGGNIAYGPRQQGVPEEEREQLVEEMLEMVRLDGYADRSIEELSGGEQQRVALARCMINNPKLVLFDEPLASLDRQLRHDMTTELRNIQAKTGSTFLYVTHNQQVALSISDRVIVLNNGKIEQVGTPDELYNEPKTEFVADFVGDMNLFTAEVSQHTDPGRNIQIGEEPLLAPPDQVSSGDLEREKMRVGIRPHDINIKLNNDNLSGHYIEGTIKGTVFGGERNVVSIETDLGEFTSQTPDRVEQGTKVYLECSQNDMHFYKLGEVTNE